MDYSAGAAYGNASKKLLEMHVRSHRLHRLVDFSSFISAEIVFAALGAKFSSTPASQFCGEKKTLNVEFQS